MGFSPDIAAIRFGEGLSPAVAPPASVAEVLGQLTGPDRTAQAFPIGTIPDFLPQIEDVVTKRRASRRGRKTDEAKALNQAYALARRTLVRAQQEGTKALFARAIMSEQPFRDRLTRFWGDHFTAIGKNFVLRNAAPHYLEGAIRPHIAGRFADMLKAAVTNPMMLFYLDQAGSFGPNSPAAKGKRGLNENFAREMLELHTLGAGGAYAQADVRQLAELLTGLTANEKNGFFFDAGRAEPDAETVLGKSYGGGPAAMDDIFAALEDLAMHPDTAAHLARKLAVHFTSDAPDAGMVDAMTQAYRASGGQLMAVYEAMLAHPFAWDSFGQKVKQPIDYIMSSLRVIALPTQSVMRANRSQLRSFLTAPMAAMGQPLFAPLGPDGWPERAEDWVTPQGLAARLQFAMAMPSAFYRSLPDPRDFVVRALGDVADARVIFAANSAETRREGVGLVLASPGFQRR